MPALIAADETAPVAPSVALVVAGGPDAVDVGPLADRADLVVAADGGLDHLVAAGRWPDLVVGDLDSVTDAALAAAEARGVEVRRHPVDKDETDLELALTAAVAAGAASIEVTGLEGGRADHALAGLLVLGSPRWAGCEVTARLRGAELFVVHAQRRFVGSPGDLISLLAIGGVASGVTTSGLRYPLTGEVLDTSSGRGLSNVFADSEAVVRVGSGVVFAIRPSSD